ncbi:hypothetical protein [Corynebacterium glyciniphilum]|uniref:hypothetical protein n=1 Tax=Corynebacterium glyciniphilum TaxID=1404244 RepID=UPI003DA0EE87
MGRHKKMLAAPAAPSRPVSASEVLSPAAVSGFIDGTLSRPRRLTARTLSESERQRYEKLLETTAIQVPHGPFRAPSLERASMVQARSPFISAEVDRKAVRVIARCLYEDALQWQDVDEFRALTKESVNRWLLRQADRVKPSSVKTYDQVLSRAGRVLYPQQFPVRTAVSGSRQKGQRAADRGAAEELYALTPLLSPSLRQTFLLVLDLITGAGLRASEIKDLKGSDFTVVPVGPGHEVVIVRIKGRWGKSRSVPVMDPAKGHRLIQRAQEVGTGSFMPLTVNAQVDRNAVNRVNSALNRLGLPAMDARGLRNRWVLDLACTPGVPASALLRLAGVGDLRVLADQVEQLPTYNSADLAGLLIDAEAYAAEVAA